MPQERCIRKTAQYGRPWLVGEVRDITEFDDDKSPIVSQHFRLITDDEQVDPDQEYRPIELEEKLKHAAEIDKSAVLTTALSKIDHDNDRHWTPDGRPSIQFVCQQAGGIDVTRAEVLAAAPDLERRKSSAND